MNFAYLHQIKRQYLAIAHILVFPKNTTSTPHTPSSPLTLEHNFPSSAEKRSNCGLICRKLDRSADVIRNLYECTVVKFSTRVHGQRQSVIAGRKKVLTASGIVKVIWSSKSDRRPLLQREYC
ncbi:hypothetical protein CDAR_233351 [Caerostris darwini]|uniref:Uncharacterized protein n=1 Tax=Caerostris darwini TaxID=1538125 RepID=A0AAV4PKS5_9ARAC|nr:hypothetical protein CDAR_233351 [Caerostris darwini]